MGPCERVLCLPELVKVERQIHTAADVAAVLVPGTDVVLGLPINLECTILIGDSLQLIGPQNYANCRAQGLMLNNVIR